MRLTRQGGIMNKPLSNWLHDLAVGLVSFVVVSLASRKPAAAVNLA